MSRLTYVPRCRSHRFCVIIVYQARKRGEVLIVLPEAVGPTTVDDLDVKAIIAFPYVQAVKEGLVPLVIRGQDHCSMPERYLSGIFFS